MKAYAITDIGKKRSFNQDYAWMTTDEVTGAAVMHRALQWRRFWNRSGKARRTARQKFWWMRSVMQTSVSGRRQRRMNS